MDRNSHKREQPKHFILANLPSCSIREHRRVSSVCLDKPTAYTYTLLTALGFKHLRTEGNSVSQLKKKKKMCSNSCGLIPPRCTCAFNIRVRERCTHLHNEKKVKTDMKISLYIKKSFIYLPKKNLEMFTGKYNLKSFSHHNPLFFLIKLSICNTHNEIYLRNT